MVLFELFPSDNRAAFIIITLYLGRYDFFTTNGGPDVLGLANGMGHTIGHSVGPLVHCLLDSNFNWLWI